MKKIIYFTVVLLLSITLIGFSAAEEKAKSDNRVASINEEGVKPNNQSSVEDKNIRQMFPAIEKLNDMIDKDILGVAGGCPKPVKDLCEIILKDCCDVSPSNPAVGCGGAFGEGGTCADCGLTCAK